MSREEAKEEGSPEVENIKSQKSFNDSFYFQVGEISRQAVARQPVKKKKMFSMSSIQ